MTKNKIKKNSLTDRHTRRGSLSGSQEEKHTRKKVSALASIRKKTIATADKNNAGIIATHDVIP